MVTASETSDFHPELLSVREREVVELAVEGHTDEQIAQALGISVSTVNSYWVRIRGKVGQSSRTEIVSRMLRMGFREANAELVAEVERLSRLLAASDRSLAHSKSDLAAERGGAWHLLALHYVPEAVLVARAPGDVVYANLQAERLFDVEPGTLVGRAVCELTSPEGREEKRRRIRTFLEAEVPGRMVMGVEEAVYALKPGGGNFRATIAIEGFLAPDEFMGVFTVREFLGDVETLLNSLRKPLIVS